jgi:hypothetical protein
VIWCGWHRCALRLDQVDPSYRDQILTPTEARWLYSSDHHSLARWQHGLARHRLSILQWSTSTLYVVSVRSVPFRNELLCWDSSFRRIPKLQSAVSERKCILSSNKYPFWTSNEYRTSNEYPSNFHHQIHQLHEMSIKCPTSYTIIYHPTAIISQLGENLTKRLGENLATTRLRPGRNQPGGRNASPKRPHRKHRPGEVVGKIHYRCSIVIGENPFFHRKIQRIIRKIWKNDGKMWEQPLEMELSSCAAGQRADVCSYSRYLTR